MNSNKVVLLGENGKSQNEFRKIGIGSDSNFDEKWLQERIFEDISLLNVVDPSFDKIALIPLCREFSLHDSVRNVFLDILAVTETGRLVLVECKLWKNPQARREVVAQIFEYASLLKSLSYGDLVAKLKKSIQSGTNDPILHQFEKHGVEFDESRLIDNISHSLKIANFQLVIAGDGIRADLVNLTKNTNFSGVIGDLSLLELGLYQSSDGSLILVPSVPAKTETIVKTVILSPDGAPVAFDEEEQIQNSEGTSSRVSDEVKAANRKFWDQFIERSSFDHPDQSPPRRGGSNWVKIDFPDPFGWITAYRGTTNNRLGVFAGVSDGNAAKARDFFYAREALLKEQLGEKIRLEFNTDQKDWGNGFFIATTKYDIEDIYDEASVEVQLSWLSETLNNFVNSLRPLSREFSEGAD
jgi:hypothetical protein